MDAVQYISGCTFGKGNLIYRPTGKQAFSFFVRASEQKVRLVLERPGNLSEDREEVSRQLLNIKPEELFIEKPPHYKLPGKAEIFDTIKCE